MSASSGETRDPYPKLRTRDPESNRASLLIPLTFYRGVSASMKIRPLHDRVIVKRLEEERTSAGGIVIPDTAAEKPSQGEVVFACPGKPGESGKSLSTCVKAA